MRTTVLPAPAAPRTAGAARPPRSERPYPLHPLAWIAAAGLHGAVLLLLLGLPAPAPPAPPVTIALEVLPAATEATAAAPAEAVSAPAPEPAPPPSPPQAVTATSEQPPAVTARTPPSIEAPAPPTPMPAIVRPPDAPPAPYRPPARHPSPPRPTPERTVAAAAPEATASPTSAAPPATPVPAAAATVSPSWQGQLSAWLQAHKAYPEAARERGEQGTTAVRFTVARDGHVLAVGLARGSGSDLLDRAASAMLRDARVPPFPAAMPQAEVTVVVNLHYALDTR